MFVEQGCRRVTMDEISQELHISKRTLYETFANKEVLLEAVLNNIKERMRIRQAEYLTKFKEKGANPLYAMLFTMNNYEHFNKRYALLLNDVGRVYPVLMEKVFCPKEVGLKQHLMLNLRQMADEGYLREGTNLELASAVLAAFVLQPMQSDYDFDHKASVSCELSFTYIRGLLKTEHIAQYEKDEEWMRQNLMITENQI